MKYAVDYSPIRDSNVLAWEDGKEPKAIVLESGKEPSKRSNVFGGPGKTDKKPKLAKKMAAQDFMVQLNSDDVIYTELGGANDRFCIGAAGLGAKLYRLPTSIISDEQKRQRLEEGKVGDEVEASASILHRFASEHPEKFYLFRELDLPIMRIKMLTRMYWMVQRKIRIGTANRLRHLKQDLDFLQIGDSRRGRLIQESFEKLMETVPTDPDELVITFEAKGDVRLRGFEKMESRFKSELQAELEKSPIYQTVFKPVPGCGPGIAGFVIAAIQDIRSYANFGRLKAKAGYHLLRNPSPGWMYQGDSQGNRWRFPKPTKGERSNWDKKFQQAVYYFTTCVDKQKLSSPWKAQLEARKLYEIDKLIRQKRDEINRLVAEMQAAGKDTSEVARIPDDMNVEKFRTMYENVQKDAAEQGESFGKMPKEYAGIQALAHKRAMRYIGQKFLQWVWTEWRKLEGLRDPNLPGLFPGNQVSAPYLYLPKAEGKDSDAPPITGEAPEDPSSEELDAIPDPEADAEEARELVEALE